MTTTWTKTETEYAIDLWNKGFSATDIGKLMNRTRHSVIGQMFRLRAKGLPIEKRASVPPPSPAQPRRATLPLPQPLSQSLAPPSLPSPHRGITDLKLNECRWPSGASPPSFCAQPIIDREKSYCPRHVIISRRGGR